MPPSSAAGCATPSAAWRRAGTPCATTPAMVDCPRARTTSSPASARTARRPTCTSASAAGSGCRGSRPTSRSRIARVAELQRPRDRRQHARGRATPPRLRREVLDASALHGRGGRGLSFSSGPSAAFGRVPAPARRLRPRSASSPGSRSAVREAASREAPPSPPAPLGRPLPGHRPRPRRRSADGLRRRSRPVIHGGDGPSTGSRFLLPYMAAALPVGRCQLVLPPC